MPFWLPVNKVFLEYSLYKRVVLNMAPQVLMRLASRYQLSLNFYAMLHGATRRNMQRSTDADHISTVY